MRPRTDPLLEQRSRSGRLLAGPLASDEAHEPRCGVLLLDDCGPHGRFGRRQFTFVTEASRRWSRRRASKRAAGVVGVAGASVVRQCLNAGILDAVRVSLVPYLIGEGSPTSPGWRRLR